MVRDEKLNSVFLIGGYDECGRTKSTEKVHINENWFCESTSDLFEPFNDYAATASKTNSNEFIGYVAGGLTNNRLCCCDL